MTRAEDIRKAPRPTIEVNFDNGKSFLVQEISPLAYNRMLIQLGKDLDVDVSDAVNFGTMLMDSPEKVMPPLLDKILIEPKIGDEADEEHITVEDITISEFNGLIMAARGILPEVVLSFRGKVQVVSGKPGD
jgi:hypothetical protein